MAIQLLRGLIRGLLRDGAHGRRAHGALLRVARLRVVGLGILSLGILALGRVASGRVLSSVLGLDGLLGLLRWLGDETLTLGLGLHLVVSFGRVVAFSE